MSRSSEVVIIVFNIYPQFNLITCALVDTKLPLTCKSVNIPIIGINQSKIRVSQVILEIQSRHNKAKFKLECLVLPKLQNGYLKQELMRQR